MLCCYGAEKDPSLGKRIQRPFGKDKATNLALSDKGSWFDQGGFDNEGSESEESDEKGLEPRKYNRIISKSLLKKFTVIFALGLQGMPQRVENI